MNSLPRILLSAAVLTVLGGMTMMSGNVQAQGGESADVRPATGQAGDRPTVGEGRQRLRDGQGPHVGRRDGLRDGQGPRVANREPRRDGQGPHGQNRREKGKNENCPRR